LARILSPGTAILLVTMEYPQEQMSAPPFSVAEAEVRALYQDAFDVRRLYTKDILEENPRFRARGLTRIDEVVYQLRLR
jgi:thiopurine S-methyltransferase